MVWARIGNRILAGSLTAAMVLGAGVARGQERSSADTRQRQSWWERESVHQELGLSSSQVNAIKTIEEQNAEATKQQRRVQQKAYRQMIALLSRGSATEEEIDQARQALDEAWSESIRLGVEHWVKLRHELTTEQWEKLPSVAPRALQMGGFVMRGMGSIRVGEKGQRQAP